MPDRLDSYKEFSVFGSIDEFREALNNLVHNTGSKRNPGQMFEALQAAGFESEEEAPDSGPSAGYSTYGQQLQSRAAAGDVAAAYELRELEQRAEQQRRRRSKRQGRKGRRGRKSAANPSRAPNQVRSAMHPRGSGGARMRHNMAFPKTINHPVYGPIQVDDMEELQALLASAPGAPAPSPYQPGQVPFSSQAETYQVPTPQGAGEALSRSRGQGRSGKYHVSGLTEVPEEEVFKYQYVYGAIGRMLGGKKTYCPALEAAVPKGRILTNQQALRYMGLSPEEAFAFRDTMYAKFPSLHGPKFDRHGNPIFDKKTGQQRMGFQSDAVTPAVQKAAHELLSDMGISCPTGIESLGNPWRRW